MDLDTCTVNLRLVSSKGERIVLLTSFFEEGAISPKKKKEYLKKKKGSFYIYNFYKYKTGVCVNKK